MCTQKAIFTMTAILLTTTTRIHFGFALLFKIGDPAGGLKNNSLNLHKKTTNQSILVVVQCSKMMFIMQ